MKSKKLSLGLALIAVIVILCIVLNMVLVQYKDTISMALSNSSGGYGDYSAEEIDKMGRDMNVRQLEEGSVLLKNDDALPLTNKKATILGYASYAYVLGNSSGASAGKTAEDITMFDAFKAAGIDVNSNGWSTLANTLRKPKHISGQVTAKNNGEKELSTYTGAFTDSVLGSYTDAAIITLGRLGGEGATMERADMQPTQNELDLIEWASGKFSKVVVLLNTPNLMEVGEVAKYADAILWIGTTGAYGIEGVANVLAGKVSPSGRTVDTWAYDMTTSPAYYNVNNNKYANFTTNGFYQYEEGIYVGYRWYETAYAEGYFDGVSNEYGTGYDGVVQYPFGYGLSYTTFTQEIKEADIDLTAHATGNSVTVTVTNTGEVAGKEVVELYLRAPYNQDTTCGINDGSTRVPLEKSDKVLVGFAKTGELAKGASEEVTVTFDTDALASYDVFGHNCYVLEKGDYEFVVGKDSHGEWDSVTENLAETIVYNADGAGARDTDKQVAVNQLDDVTTGDGAFSATLSEAYLSRSDFEGGMDKIKLHGPSSTDENVSSDVLSVLNTAGQSETQWTYDVYENGRLTTRTTTYYFSGARVEAYADVNYYGESMSSNDFKVTYGDSSKMTAQGLTFADMEGADYDDERWEAILDALTIEDMIKWQSSQDSSPALASIGKELGKYTDGACQVGADKGWSDSTWFAASCVTASSWNVELAEELGEVYGYQAVYYNCVGVYAPSMNIHRTPLGARNIEYYSEDGFISGKIGAAQVNGIQSTKTMVFLKHCLLNENDTNRSGAITWVNEQALREIYGVPYEYCVKTADARGIMSSLNRIGLSWSHPGFYLSILRDEWGFNGMVITDMVTAAADCTTSNVALLSGVAMLKGDSILSFASSDKVSSVSDLSNYTIYMLREVAHFGLYQYVNSDAFIAPAVEPNTTWYVGWIILDVVLVAGLVLVYIFLTHKPLVAAVKAMLSKSAEADGEEPESAENTNEEE